MTDFARQIERRFAFEKGCQPLRPWSAKWPCGLDLLLKVFRYAQEEKVLRLFVDVVGESGTTFEQRLLGVKGIDTVDPKNIEAILSTDFASRSIFPSTRLPTDGFLSTCFRLHPRTSTSTLQASSRFRHFHSGWRSMEAIQTAVAATVRLQSPPELSPNPALRTRNHRQLARRRRR